MTSIALLLLLACGEKDETGAPDGGATDGGGSGDGGAVDCWTVRPDACASTAGCVELKAREVVADTDGAYCVDSSEPGEVVGCMPSDVDCGSAISYATAPALPDSCFQFASTCIVAGWVHCADDAMTAPGECS